MGKPRRTPDTCLGFWRLSRDVGTIGKWLEHETRIAEQGGPRVWRTTTRMEGKTRHRVTRDLAAGLRQNSERICVRVVQLDAIILVLQVVGRSLRRGGTLQRSGQRWVTSCRPLRLPNDRTDAARSRRPFLPALSDFDALSLAEHRLAATG